MQSDSVVMKYFTQDLVFHPIRIPPGEKPTLITLIPFLFQSRDQPPRLRTLFVEDICRCPSYPKKKPFLEAPLYIILQSRNPAI